MMKLMEDRLEKYGHVNLQMDEKMLHVILTGNVGHDMNEIIVKHLILFS